ncbi:MAG: hypothetical protein VW881_05455 [Alphaproteobacteria bacterium]
MTQTSQSIVTWVSTDRITNEQMGESLYTAQISLDDISDRASEA